jgi:hypothetical protein
MRAQALAVSALLLIACPIAAQPQAAPAPAPSPPAAPPPVHYPPAVPATTPAPAPETAEQPSAPPGYYVEQAPQQPPASTDPRAPATAEPVYEPPPPGGGPIYEPPPPPVPRHVAPRTALWVGLRAGYFLPFGNVYARALPADQYGFYGYAGVPWRDYAGPGVMLELNAGVRLSRNYNVFALWERGQLTSGNAEQNVFGGQSGADTDFWAVGVRATTDADKLGFITELALGYRQARAHWEDGTELQFTDAIFEGRLGLGVDIRLNELFALSPMVTIGVGSFGDIERVLASGVSYPETRGLDAMDSHAWFTLGVGGHVDLFGSKR